MSSDDEIKQKLYNIERIVEDIRQCPQTYNTILGQLSCNGTCQVILRRKFNSLCKNGIICKMTIPGTRFGKVIFYIIPKKYKILIEGTRLGSEVYYFNEYKKISRFWIKVDECWHLKNNKWENIGSRKFFDGYILKMI